MASLYRRGNVWWIKYRRRGRVVRGSLGTTVYNEARREKSRIERELDERTFQEPSLTPLKGFLEDYLALLKATRPHKSYKNDVSYLRLIFGPVCAELAPHDSLGRPVSAQRWRTGRPVKPICAEHLEDVTPSDISGFIADRVRVETIAPKTANRTREVLHRMFAYARKHCGYVSPDAHWVNPAAPVDRISEPAPQIRFLNRRQIKKQLDALVEARSPLREMVAVLIYAGLRREELLWLTTDDVDLDARVIRVRAKTTVTAEAGSRRLGGIVASRFPILCSSISSATCLPATPRGTSRLTAASSGRPTTSATSCERRTSNRD